jgi:hypothetical protein
MSKNERTPGCLINIPSLTLVPRSSKTCTSPPIHRDVTATARACDDLVFAQFHERIAFVSSFLGTKITVRIIDFRLYSVSWCL